MEHCHFDLTLKTKANPNSRGGEIDHGSWWEELRTPTGGRRKELGPYLHPCTAENLSMLSSHGKHLIFRGESNIKINIMCERSSHTQFRNNLVY